MKIDTAQTPFIDFDAGAEGWKRNKRPFRASHSTFVYVCGHPRSSDGKACQGVPYVRCRALKRHRVAWSKCRHHLTDDERHELLREIDGVQPLAEPQSDVQG